MGTATLEILRADPRMGVGPSWHSYSVPVDGTSTVLHSLQYLNREIVPSLAFRFSCRFERCGLCSAQIDGKAMLACRAHLSDRDRRRVEPLAGFPVIKDLVIERGWIVQVHRDLSFGLVSPEVWSEDLILPREYQVLSACIGCLCCVSSCPNWSYENVRSFGGPYVFVRLAQLHVDPRDHVDRRRQAEGLGIHLCLSCDAPCRCVMGLKICETAVETLTR